MVRTRRPDVNGNPPVTVAGSRRPERSVGRAAVDGRRRVAGRLAVGRRGTETPVRDAVVALPNLLDPFGAVVNGAVGSSRVGSSRRQPSAPAAR
ncbi:hypothetical protein BRD13_07285 [Halobacteriales archaeon SW_5_70_135]|nr:MAG: hypothetical protein BRD13_07285 [Halobacteriales archaeon SW_5_70_135]